MTNKVVAIIGALDTKAAEYAFLKQKIESQGVGTLMIARFRSACSSDM